MDDKEFAEFCKGLEEGEEKYVENLGSHETAKVIFCSGNRLEVDVNGSRETWAVDSCKEIHP